MSDDKTVELKDKDGNVLSEAAKAQIAINAATRDADANRERANRFEAELAESKEKLLEAQRKLSRLAQDKAKTNPEDLEKWQKDEEARIRGELQVELDKRDKSLLETATKLKELTVVSTVFAIAAEKFNEDVTDDVKDRIRKSCDQDAQGNIVIKGEDGKPRYSKTAPSKLMDAVEFVEELAASRPSWCKPVGVAGLKTGSVKTGASRNGASAVPGNISQMTKAQQVEWFKNNPDAAKNYRPI